MRIDHQVVVFDAADLASESSFWAGVLDGTVDAEDDWHMVLVDGEPRIGVQLAPDHVPPDWPDGTPPQQIHLDLWVEDFGGAHVASCRSVRRVLKPAEDGDSQRQLPGLRRSGRAPVLPLLGSRTRSVLAGRRSPHGKRTALVGG